MSTIIKILRSSGTAAPSSLAQGELAYTFGTGTQGNLGDRLFIGTGTETDGAAANIDVIGGKYFANLTDHVHGTLTASSAIIVDSNKAIDELFIGNNSSTGGTIKFNEGTNNGTNFVALKAPNSVASDITFTLPGTDGTNGQVLTTNGSGALSFATISGNLTIADDSSSTTTISLATDTLKIAGGTGLTSTISGDTITLDIDSTVVTETGTQTLTNKTLTSPVISTISNSGTLTLPTSTDTLVGRATTDTLTNKTINGSNNTITNISNSSLVNSNITLVDDTSSTTTISLGESLKISGDTGITTTISGDTVNIDLDDTTVTPNTYGSSTAIPVITIDQQGRITSASTQNISTTLTISDDTSTTANITLGTDTLKIAGGTGITSSISGDTITLDIDSTVVTESSTDTLTNKTINGSNNTISNIGNSSLVNSTITIADDSSTTSSVSLGQTLKIAGGTGLTSSVSGNTITLDIDSSVVTESSTDTLTNKSISLSTNTITGTLAEFNTALSDADFATLAGTETLSNKTLTAPKFADDGFIADANGNELIIFNTIGSAVNQLEVSNSATGNGVTIASTGSDTNINIVLDPKGSGTVDVNSSRITSLSNPSSDQDAATKAYVDSVANGLDVKASVRVATTTSLPASTYDNGAGTITADANGALIIDGVTLLTNNRVLVKNQNAEASVQNGLYKVTATGSGGAAFVLTRTPDGDEASEITGGAFVFVEEGTVNADNGFVFTHNGTPTLGTDPITVVQFSGAGQISAGNALTKTGNTLDVAVDNTTIEVSSDALRVKASGISANELASDAVTTAKILDANVTTGKINDLAVTTGKINDLAVTTGKINDLAVTTGKIADSAVTNVKLANSSIFFTDESSTQGSVSLGGNIEFLAGEGIDTTVLGNTVRISGELATSSNAGVAFFPTANFVVTTGSVAITKIDGGTF